MKLLGSLFIESPDDDLSTITGLPIQLSFYKRATFRNFNHNLLLQRLKENNISVESIHAPAADIYHSHGDEFISMLQTIRDYYKVQVITVHPQRGDRRQAKALYKKIEDRIQKMGIIIAYETFEAIHEERKWISQIEDMHRYFDALKFPFLGVTYDFTHSDASISVQEIHHFHKKIHAIHFSDARTDLPLDPNEKHQHLALGFGNYPVLDFLHILQKVDYKGFLILEYLPAYQHHLKDDYIALQEFISGNKKPFLDLYKERQSTILH